MHCDGDQMCDHLGENQMYGFKICASQTVPIFEAPTLYDNSLIGVTLLVVLFHFQNVNSSSKILLKRKTIRLYIIYLLNFLVTLITPE